MGGITLLLRRARADAGLLVLLVAVVAATAGAAGAVPRLLTTLARASLADAAADARPDQLGLAASGVREFTFRDAGSAARRFEVEAEAAARELPPVLADVLAAPVPVVDSVRFDLGTLPGQPPDALTRRLTIRAQPGLGERVSLVEGRLPDGEVPVEELVLPGQGRAGEPLDLEVPVHEFVATRDTAEGLAMVVGDRRVGRPDPTGPVLSRVLLGPSTPVLFELVGIVELTPVDDPVWFADPRLHRPSRFDSLQSTEIFGFGWVPDDALTELPYGRSSGPAALTVRWQLDLEALLDADVPTVAAEARALRAVAPLDPAELRWATGLDRVLADEAARRAAAVEVLGLGAVSVVGVALALLAVVAGLLAVRRRDATALGRGRGASRPQLLGAAAVEAGGVGLLGLAIAAAVLAGTLPAGTWAPAVVVALLAVATLVLGAVPDVRRPLGALLAARRRGRDRAGGRPVLEGLLVVVAIVAALGLRRRGVAVDGAADPLVAAAPALVAGAAAVVVARLVPLPVAAAERAARWLRSVTVPVGLARAARRPAGGGLVALVVLGVALTGLAAAVHGTLIAGTVRAAAERVGADVRIGAQPLSTLPDDLVALDGAGDDVAVPLSQVPGTLVTDVGAQRLDVLLVDADGVAALGSDRGTLPDLAWDGTGATPVVVSSVLRPAGSPGVDDAVSVLVGTSRVAGRIVAVDPRVLGLDRERTGAFVVLDRAAAAAAGIAPGSTSLLVRTDDPDAVVAAVDDADLDADVLVRHAVEADLRDAPLGRGVRTGFLVVALGCAVATVLALALAVVASGPERRRGAAVLRAVGAGRGTARAVALVELLPAVALAAVAGVTVAAGLAALLGERLDLRAFTGTVDATTVGAPPLVVAVALVLVVVLVTGAATVVTLGRVDLGTLLREGDG